jgi:hypothetical protein
LTTIEPGGYGLFMTTTNRPTPDDVELITYGDVELGDTLVAFTPIGGHVITPPTQRQLQLKRTRWTVAQTIQADVSAGGFDVVVINGKDCIYALPTAACWRVKR